MNHILKLSIFLVLLFGMGNLSASSPNQTPDLSPILPARNLPFNVVIEQAHFQLSAGNHSGVVGTYHGLWIIIGGSSVGLHGFGGAPFLAAAQNRTIYVINPKTGQTLSRSLTDPNSGLNQQQIDSLSTINAQSYQENNTLYISGGYGIDTATNTFGTKPLFTALNLPGVVKWVTEPQNNRYKLINFIRQIENPIFQITGGAMYRLGNKTQLVFGQNFIGPYTSNSNGEYSKQVRQFEMKENNGQLFVTNYDARPLNPSPNYRRRDLNIVPVILNNNNHPEYALVAYGGVFTLNLGVWTVPVIIKANSELFMPDPNLETTFKQGMNQYTCAQAGLYSQSHKKMYTLFFGGISYGYFAHGQFETNAEIPFINQVTTIQIDHQNHFTQYIMDNQFPLIPSTGHNPGNPLLFGAEAYFIPKKMSQYPNEVINLDNIRQPTVIGYIVGGIQSSLPSTIASTDTAASKYVFKVTLIPKIS